MWLNRREFLWNTAASGLIVPFTTRAQTHGTLASRRFRHGVASGDPLTDRVILWTRISAGAIPAGSAGAPNGASAVDVRWRVAADPALAKVVASGTVRTAASRDFTVKVDAGGLEPATTYYYGFDTGIDRSPVGRTRTLPAADVTRLRLAVVSCANYPYGFFNVYGRVAARADLDAVLHLGDYMYEFENGRYGDGAKIDRVPRPVGETVTLDDYRMRYETYRSDPHLQEAHRQHPFITVWDDHELTNNAWRDGGANHQPENEGDWPTRRAAAYRAYLEWMPVREHADFVPRLYRTFRFGRLADLVMLDARSLRDEQVAVDDLAGLADPKRTVLGAAQEAWCVDQLRASARAQTRWRLLGQQVLFARMTPGGQKVRNADSWDGYQAARDRLLDALQQEQIRDVVILTGDVHSSWALDVPRSGWDGYNARTGEGSLAVELVAPAISSPPIFANDGKGRERAAALKVMLPHLKFMDGDHRGYVVLDVTPERIRADWFFVPTVQERTDKESHAASLVSERGSSHLVDAGTPAPSREGRPLAPSS
jgi:alkaline phosphatase D